MLSEGRAGLLILSVCALSLLNAAAPLNPTVKVIKHPKAPLPPECDESVAPQPSPRIQLAEAAPVPVVSHAATVRDLLQETQAAAARNDFEGFNDALARLKAMPDRGMGGDVIRVYDDLSRLWRYEFESPTGAFFDRSSDLLAMLSGYPGYERAVEEQTLTAGGVKLYPSRESRDFLVREAASRLAKLGLARKPAPVVAWTTRQSKRTPKRTATKHVQSSAAMTTATQPAQKNARVHHTKTKPKPRKEPAPQIAEAKPPVVHKTVAATPIPASKPAPSPVPVPVSKPAPSPVPVPVSKPAPVPAPISKPAPAPATPVRTPVPGTTTTAAPPTQTTPPPVTTTTAAPVTTTTAAPATTTTAAPVPAPATTDTTPTTASTETTATTAPQQPQTSPMRNVILPIILIVIGVGVLIVLFRASS